jgi:alpha-L-rhamnosidase
MKKLSKYIILSLVANFLLLLTCSGSYLNGFSSDTIKPSGLKCESKENPLGIDSSNPRLDWNLMSRSRDYYQSAYQIIVSSDIVNLSKNKGDLWDSGKIPSDKSVEIRYSGIPLQSRMICFWKARVWDRNDKVSPWSEYSSWEMGLLNKSDWTGKWINDGKKSLENEEELYNDDPAPLFRKKFAVEGNIRRARLYITGLGYYLSYLNGKRIGDHELDPGWTNYAERIYYSTYDVTTLLQEGNNCLGVMTGNGWYNPLPLRMWGSRNLRKDVVTGRPEFICQLFIEKSDGEQQIITSDNTWKFNEGPIIRNNIYLGEVYDARKEILGWNETDIDDANWKQVSIANGITGILEAQPQPPIKITAKIKPVKISEPSPGLYIFDMGQNFAGWAHFHFNASKGAKLTMRYGELLNMDGTLNPLTSVCGQIKGKRKDKTGNFINIGGPGSPEIAWQSDVYIAKGEGTEEYTPRFTFHGFRYVEIAGLDSRPDLNMCEGLRLNSSVEPVGEFSCSDSLLNSIQRICEWTFLSNIFSVQSDCPHRERFGYGGDIVGTSEAFMYNFNMSDFYSKTVSDWKDASLKDGMFTDTAPFVGIQYCGVGWAMVHPLLQLQLCRYYGNASLIEKQYPAAKKWINLVAEQNPDFIIHDGLSDHEGLTDRPADLMVTPLYYQTVKIMEKLAGILNLSGDAQIYRELSKKISDAYTNKFLDRITGKVGNGTQGSQSFALYTGIIPLEFKGKVLDYLLNDIRVNKASHLSTGILGTKFMLDELSRSGYHELALKIVQQTDFPGWGYMLANGATTLWEHWAIDANTYSHNHPMFGSVSQWFFSWLGGIQPDGDACGFNRIIIRPQTQGSLSWVKCSYLSVNGKIVSNWSKKNGVLIMDIEIPANTSAKVSFPSSHPQKIMVDGKILTQAAGISNCTVTDSVTTCNIVSGKYAFFVRDNSE